MGTFFCAHRFPESSDLLKKVTSGGLVTEYGYETHRNLKTQVRNTWAPPPANETVLSQYDYRYDELGRRESVGNSGTAFINGEKSVFHNIHAYNDRNELTGSVRKEGTVAAPAATVDAEGRLYEYDPIGNRINSTGGTGPQVTYARNGVNQYTALTGGISASPAYDDDGNMTGYDGAAYTWNAENRLTTVETADRKITFLYDYMGRRVQKKVFSNNGTGWNTSPDEIRVFVYDGWSLIRETVTGAASGETYYVWGLDLSQSFGGAGGIGGLLCSVSGGEVRRYAYDANGNVGQLVNEDGTIAARYEYDPFGNEIRAEGDDAQNNPFRFSTKYYDAETGLYYYGFRYYLAELGRWISRDPIGEHGGINLYSFVYNNYLFYADFLGLCDFKQIGKDALNEVFRNKLLKISEKKIKNWAIKAGISSGADGALPIGELVAIGMGVWDGAALVGEAFGLLKNIKILRLLYDDLVTNFDNMLLNKAGDRLNDCCNNLADDLKIGFRKGFDKRTKTLRGHIQKAFYKLENCCLCRSGSKRGPKTDPNAPHNKKIKEVADSVKGGEVIAGGQTELPEVLIKTPGGIKPGRRPDILVQRPDGSQYGINVGKTTANGAPIKREADAINDLEGAGVEMHYVPYD